MGNQTAAPRRRSRLVLIAIVCALVLLGAEAVTRARASALPPPLKWATTDLDRKVQQIEELREAGGASVVFLGSSTVDAGVDPSALSIPASDRPAYNAAVRGGTIRMVSTWAKEIAIPRLRPDVVVVGVASRELNENDASQRLREELFFDAPAVRHLLGNETPLLRAERTLESASALFKYRTWIRDPRYLKALFGVGAAPTVTQTAIGDYLAPDGQFLFFRSRTYKAKESFGELPGARSLSDAHRAALRGLLTFLRKNVERVVVVNMPVTRDYASRQPARQPAAFDAILRAEAARAGASYKAFGVWPTTDFADPTHTNAAGSKRLTARLATLVA